MHTEIVLTSHDEGGCVSNEAAYKRVADSVVPVHCKEIRSYGSIFMSVNCKWDNLFHIKSTVL